MAIYHFESRIIGRKQGRSVVAAAAYRAAAVLSDVAKNRVHDYHNKSADLAHEQIIFPEGTPLAYQDRETLWNAVEQGEKRKDAQLAREVVIALPKELSMEQNIALAQTFAQQTFVDQGMIADVCIHKGHKGGKDQPHAHILLTMREITPEGFGEKVRDWNDRALLKSWREHWALQCNQALTHWGHACRIDHRTLKAQGIDLIPQDKIGPKEATFHTRNRARHEAISKENGARILQDPLRFFAALTAQQSVFRKEDISRLLQRHSVDEGQFKTLYAILRDHDELMRVSNDEQGKPRFTTRTHFAMEERMIELAQSQAKSAAKKNIKPRHQRQALRKVSLSPAQQPMFDHLMQNNRLACVVGFAGTGKSYALGACRQAWEKSGFEVKGMTLSGIAAENLTASSGIESRTVASYLWHWARDRDVLTSNDIVVVDEAGMLGSRQMSQLLEAVEKVNAKLVLIGDPEQLQAIEAGGAFRAIADRVGYYSLEEVRRQKALWQKTATKDFGLGNTQKALDAYSANQCIHACTDESSAIEKMVQQWQQIRQESPEKTQLLLAYHRQSVRALNEAARSACREQGTLGRKESVLLTAQGKRYFSKHDRVYFLRNNSLMGVKNGTLGTISKIRGDQVTVWLDASGEQPRQKIRFSIRDYDDIDHGYAATVHKSQGTTVDCSYVFASPAFDRHVTYVAMSRHRESAQLFYSQEDFPNDHFSLAKKLARARHKPISLDCISKPMSASLVANDAFKRDIKSLKSLYQDTKAMANDTGWHINNNPLPGDEGVYRGDVCVGGEIYGMMATEANAVTLLPDHILDSRDKEQRMNIQMLGNRRHYYLKARQHGRDWRDYARSKAHSINQEMEIDR